MILLPGCGTPDEGVKQASSKPVITVSILPQKFFLEKLAGDQFHVNVMIPPGYSPASYEPTPKQIKSLNDSRMYLRIGHIPFEKGWIEKFKSLNPGMKVFDTSTGIDLIETAQAEEGHHHHEGEDGHHHHGGVDPHVWLSPKSVRIIAANTCQALIAEFPQRKELFNSRLNIFIKDLQELDLSITEALKGLQRKSFLTFHPAWSYFARDYGLAQLAIEIGGKSPNPSEMVEVIKKAKGEKIGIIFVQQQFRKDTAQVIAREIGAEIVQLDPLAYNWDINMMMIAREFKKALIQDGKTK
jgi:zinc transport system substrate-binding protein